MTEHTPIKAGDKVRETLSRANGCRQFTGVAKYDQSDDGWVIVSLDPQSTFGTFSFRVGSEVVKAEVSR